MPNRTQQYARTTGSSYARMILRTVSLRIDQVVRSLNIDRVVCAQMPRQLGKAVEALVPACRPAVAHDHDVSRRPRPERAHELRAERLDLRPLDVVEEV